MLMAPAPIAHALAAVAAAPCSSVPCVLSLVAVALATTLLVRTPLAHWLHDTIERAVGPQGDEPLQ